MADLALHMGFALGAVGAGPVASYAAGEEDEPKVVGEEAH